MPNKDILPKKAMRQNTINIILSALTVSMCLMILFCAIMTTRVFKRSEMANQGERDFIVHSNAMISGLSYLTDQARSYSQYGETQYYENYMKEIESKRIENAIESIRAMLGENSTLLEGVIQCNDNLVRIEDEAIALIKSQKREEARKLLYGTEYVTQNQTLQTLVVDMQANIQKEIQKVILQEANTVGLLTMGSVLMVLILLVFQLLTYIVTKKAIILPIAKLRDLMISVGGGNLSQETDVPVDTSEIGELCGAIQNMQSTLSIYVHHISDVLNQFSHRDLTASVDVDFAGDFAPIKISLQEISRSLNEAFLQIKSSAEQVASGSEQVSSGAQALSQGATQQASSIEELVATITEISSQIKTNAENASDVNDKAAYVCSEILDSNKQMQNLTQAMSEISTTSAKISTVIKTIEDIAFQTNILALNAAVEAARAGVAGKGFAVVADEVRNLASKSAEAAKGTTSLIESSIRAVENGTQIADTTAKSLSVVVEGANEIVVAVGRISDASSRQSSAISQVTIGMDEISSVVQTNSATAEESAATSEQLSSQAMVLKSLVEMFQLKDNYLKDNYSQPLYVQELPVSADYEPDYFAGSGSNKY